MIRLSQKFTGEKFIIWCWLLFHFENDELKYFFQNVSNSEWKAQEMPQSQIASNLCYQEEVQTQDITHRLNTYKQKTNRSALFSSSELTGA